MVGVTKKMEDRKVMEKKSSTKEKEKVPKKTLIHGVQNQKLETQLQISIIGSSGAN